MCAQMERLACLILAFLPLVSRAISLPAGDHTHSPITPIEVAPGHGLEWSECTIGKNTTIECANMTVPMDWSHQRSNQTITIALGRLRCTEPTTRIGSLVFNPGGPGHEAMSFLHKFSDRLNRHFDIVTMDPRGTGKSMPIECAPRQSLNSVGFPQTEGEYDTVSKYNRDVAQACYNSTGDIMKHVDTASIARDLEALRIALGEGKMTFFGSSWGTQLAATYAELFPTGFRAMVMDGVHDNTFSHLEMSKRLHAAYQGAFDRFTSWCASNSSCLLHGKDVHQALHRALELAGEKSSCLADLVVTLLLESHYTDIAKLIAEVVCKDLLPVKLVRRLIDPHEKGSFQSFSKDENATNLSDLCDKTRHPRTHSMKNLAVRCLDAPLAQPNISDFINAQHWINASTPAAAQMTIEKELVATCLGWPSPTRNPPHRLGLPEDLPPVFIVQSLYDYRTPYENAVNIQSQIPNSVLLTTRKEGHCTYTRKGSEASRMIEEYLISGRLPAEGTILDGRFGGDALRTWGTLL